MVREERNQEEMEAMQSHIQEQEQLIRELEESANHAQEQLRYLKNSHILTYTV